jgi:hypothetical protein
MHHPEQPTKRLGTARDLAQALKCGISTVYSEAKKGRIPCVRFGKKGIRFDIPYALETLSQPARK